jgi:hypothetical protein
MLCEVCSELECAIKLGSRVPRFKHLNWNFNDVSARLDLWVWLLDHKCNLAV